MIVPPIEAKFKRSLFFGLTFMFCFIIAISAVFAIGTSDDVDATYIEGTISGTTGLGTEESPVCVDTALELKQALEHSEITYVLVTNNIRQGINGDSHGWNTLNNYFIAISSDKTLITDYDVLVYSSLLGGITPQLTSFIAISGNATLTLEGSGSILSEFAGNDTGIKSTIYVNSGKLVVNGVDVGITNSYKWSSFGNAVYANKGTEITVNGGHLYGYTFNDKGTAKLNGYDVQSYAITTNGKLTINDGKFSVGKANTADMLDEYFPINYNSSNFIINGGCFEGKFTETEKAFVKSGLSVVKTDLSSVTLPTEETVLVCNPSKTILKVEATFVEPVAGEEASFTLSGLDSKTSYTVKWFDRTNNKELVEGDKFVANTEYEVQIVITPATGFGFVYVTTCKVNFNEPSLIDGKYTLSLRYNTDAEILNSVKITIKEPVIGEKPDKNPVFSDDRVYAHMVEWYQNGNLMKDDDIFRRGLSYSVTIIVYVKDEYAGDTRFKDGTTSVTINDDAITDPWIGSDFINTNKHSPTSFTFDPVVLDTVSAEIKVPVFGEKPDCTGIAGTDTHIHDVEWYVCKSDWTKLAEVNADDTFEYKYYTAYILIYPGIDSDDIGVSFADTLTSYKVNGTEAKIYGKDKNYVTLEVHYTVSGDITHIDVTSQVPIEKEYSTDKAATTATTSDGTVTLKWYNADDTEASGMFSKDVKYTGKYVITYDSTTFAGKLVAGTKVSVNGMSANVTNVDSTNNKIECSMEFTSLNSSITSDTPNFVVDAPILGKLTDWYPTSDSDQFECTVYGWYGISGSTKDMYGYGSYFTEDYEIYRVGLTVSVVYGYETFQEGQTFTVNGMPVNIEQRTYKMITGYIDLPLHSHDGSNATCTSVAHCDVCDIDYGELNPEKHSGTASVYVANNNGTHDVKYDCCNELHSANVACVNSEATCTEKAKCEHCGAEHSNLNPENHSMDTFVYVPNEDVNTHSKQHECCGAVVIAEEAHTFGSDNKCTACGMEKGHTHTYPDTWTTDSEYHWKLCDCGHKNEVAAHHHSEGSSCDVCGYENKSDGGFPIIAIVGVVAVIAIAGVGAFFYLRNKP